MLRWRQVEIAGRTRSKPKSKGTNLKQPGLGQLLLEHHPRPLSPRGSPRTQRRARALTGPCSLLVSQRLPRGGRARCRLLLLSSSLSPGVSPPGPSAFPRGGGAAALPWGRRGVCELRGLASAAGAAPGGAGRGPGGAAGAPAPSGEGAGPGRGGGRHGGAGGAWPRAALRERRRRAAPAMGPPRPR